MMGIKAWYFSDESKKLRYGDGRDIAVGVTHSVDGPIKKCKHGLHGSVKAIDAIQYAPDAIVWRVELDGEMDKDEDKIAAERRTYLAGGVDATDTLRAFARWCALQVIDKWDAPEIVRRYLATGDESIRDAARAAAWDAARDAARDAAWDAARDAARAAAWDAARAAARDAARDAARAAARDAARANQNAKLESMLADLIGYKE